MIAITTSRRLHRVSICAAIAFLLSFAGPALAGGGQVVPAGAKPKGYSLEEAAAATAYFNTGVRIPENLPEDFPFQILYVDPDLNTSFTVKPGTMLYVPIVYSTDVDAALWPFPDVTNPLAVSAYFFDPLQLGAEYIRITVDGKTTTLGPGYAAGAVTPGLPDGGNAYTVVAAFLTPLSKGKHTVTISSRFTGEFIAMHHEFFPGGVFESVITYKVIVR
jgi:hypothetical protein